MMGLLFRKLLNKRMDRKMISKKMLKFSKEMLEFSKMIYKFNKII